MREYKKIAIYLRISMEDKAGDGKILKEQWESKSISSQRKLLLEFISRDAKLAEQEIAEFSDDRDIIGLNQKTFSSKGFTD